MPAVPGGLFSYSQPLPFAPITKAEKCNKSAFLASFCLESKTSVFEPSAWAQQFLRTHPADELLARLRGSDELAEGLQGRAGQT